jgi:hypothetical protein
VAYLSRFLPEVTVKGKVFTVPGIDVDQTHSGSLEGIPTIMCGSKLTIGFSSQSLLLVYNSSSTSFTVTPSTCVPDTSCCL